MRTLLFWIACCTFTPMVLPAQESATTLVEDVFYLFRKGYDYSEEQQKLADYPYDSLVAELDTDAKRKAFWMNVYNLYTQLGLENHADLYAKRAPFFSKKLVRVAGQEFSLNRVEHGILRRSQVLWGLGLLRKPFPKRTERELRVEALDYRVHFALNCGAKSCPAIRYYEAHRIDEQLDRAEAAFMESDVEYDSVRNEVTVSRIFSWYRHDFGGKKGIRALLVKHGKIPADTKVKIHFRKYDWSAEPKQYAE